MASVAVEDSRALPPCWTATSMPDFDLVGWALVPGCIMPGRLRVQLLTPVFEPGALLGGVAGKLFELLPNLD
jgi:hypothetical protein